MKALGAGNAFSRFAYQAQMQVRRGLLRRKTWIRIGDTRVSDYPIEIIPSKNPVDRPLRLPKTDIHFTESDAYKEAQQDIVRHLRSGSSAIVAEYDIDTVSAMEELMEKKA